MKKSSTAVKQQNTKELQEVYEKFGYPSNELKKQVERYILYLLHRYYFDFNNSPFKEDLIQECYAKLSKSLTYYDPEKGTVSTFVFTALRNTIGYYRRKHVKETAFTDKYEFVAFEVVESDELHQLEVGDHVLNKAVASILLDDFLTFRLPDSFKKHFLSGICSYPNLEKFLQWKNF